MLVGLLGPSVAYALWRRPARRPLGIAFNTVGLLDLVVAIPLGLLHAPGRLQLIVTEPTTAIMGLLPMALVPTFVVPLAIVLHVASLRLVTRRGGLAAPADDDQGRSCCQALPAGSAQRRRRPHRGRSAAVAPSPAGLHRCEMGLEATVPGRGERVRLGEHATAEDTN